MRAILLMLMMAMVGGMSRFAQAQPPAVTVYHEDPAHLWNRVHRALLVRTTDRDQTFGLDSVDPILWANTKHLLEGESHRAAIDVLHEFIATDGERLIDDPVKRAILQRDLWAIFDWTCTRRDAYAAEQRALRERLAAVMRRVALSPEQIATLPGMYAAAVEARRFPVQPEVADPNAPFLPADLFHEQGPWLYLAVPGEVVAPGHARVFSRSIFEVFLRHPEGREAGIEYLHTVSDFADPYVLPPDPPRGQRRVPVLNPGLPQFPVGTQVALVRRAMLVEADGKPSPTRLIESIQLRAYLHIPGKGEPRRPGDQSFHEFVLTRRGLFEHPSQGLRAIGRDEEDMLFVNLASHGIDWIERPPNRPDEVRRLTHPVFASCFHCHSGAGIHSLNSFTRFMGTRTDRPTMYHTVAAAQETYAVRLKRERYDWGLLEQHWGQLAESR
jgi:hypothetical protein